jgi:undecaprenyl-diphosphatase
LVLGQRLMGIGQPELLFDIAVHVGTLLAVLVVFRSDLWDMVHGLFSNDRQGRRGRKLIFLVVVGTIPAVLIGLTMRETFEALFGSTLAVGVALLVTGLLLILTRRAAGQGRSLQNVGPISALLIGLAQAMAITPGISRSGATISLALLIGVERELAARYSFLLSIPAILGAVVLESLHTPSLDNTDLTPLILGAAVAAVSGYVALKVLLKVVSAGRLYLFAPYCWALGLAAIIFSL